MKRGLADYKAVRSKLYCTRTCDPIGRGNWGRSAVTQDGDLSGDLWACDADCEDDWDTIGPFLKAKYGEDNWKDVRKIEFIHRQTLRGIGTMEMNKLIGTFCK
jgi:hypothetical protein